MWQESQILSMSMVSDFFFLEEALKDKAQTLEDISAGSEHALLETEPTKWLPDSAAPSCTLCGARFHPKNFVILVEEVTRFVHMI
jgi:hypothetical protein